MYVTSNDVFDYLTRWSHTSKYLRKNHTGPLDSKAKETDAIHSFFLVFSQKFNWTYLKVPFT